MMERLKKYFGQSSGDSAADAADKGLHDIRIAACALFLEMAEADGEFSSEERESILSILHTEYDLSRDDAALLIEASRKAREQSTDLWHFTNLINQNYSTEEKIRIIELVWKIIFSDHKLDAHEDYLVHKLANLLRLQHKQLIEAKLRALNRK
jgi:uncharacterized tellurite resistance protein B-like protein